MEINQHGAGPFVTSVTALTLSGREAAHSLSPELRNRPPRQTKANDINELNDETRELTIEELDAASGGLDFSRIAKDLAISGLQILGGLLGGSKTIDHMIDVIDPFARMD
jgi:hypothetical protein